jgi:hypothetical protein
LDKSQKFEPILQSLTETAIFNQMSKRKVLSKSYEVEEIVAKKVTDGKVLY